LSKVNIEKAKYIRKQEILWDNQFVNMCHTHLARDANYNIKAYQIITPKQILMSEKEFYSSHLKECEKLLKGYQDFKKMSREVIVQED